MCTATWLAEPGGYQLFFNRDELRSRKPALPPAVRERRGMRYLAPEDGEAGGTWIAVNQAGVSVGLLNGAAAAPLPDREWTSRGTLVSSLADAGGWQEVRRRLADLALADIRPFTLVVAEPGAGLTVRAADWDGLRLTVSEGEPEMPLASSGYDHRQVQAVRRRLWTERQAGNGPLTPETLLAFHRSHEPERGPFSPCMHRPEARSVSFTRVRVTPKEVTLWYTPGPPCVTAPGEPVSLPRPAPEPATGL